MSRYLITIAPDNGAADGDRAHTTVRVDTSTGRTRITELTIRSATGSGLAPADLPAIDMDLLIRALTASGQTQPLAVEPPTPAATAAPSAPQPEAGESASVAAVVAVEPRRRRKAAGTATAPAKKATASKTTGRKATARKAAATKKATAGKTTKTTSRRQPAALAAAAPRAYRRMPDPEQVMDVYRQTGSITGVAEHFGVPRHTVAGWARRLRGQGHTIGRA